VHGRARRSPARSGPRAVVTVLLAAALAGPAGVRARPASARTPTGAPSRYAVATASGAVATFGGAGFEGDATGPPSPVPVVAIAATRDGEGYWLATRGGGVRAFGDASSGSDLGTTGWTVGLTTDPTGSGWWAVTSTGTVTAGGGAPALAAPGAHGSPVRGIAAAGGRGVWLARSDGTVTAVGVVPPLAAPRTRGPLAAIAATPDRGGYWTVTTQGTVVAAGDANWYGSWTRPASPAAGIAASVDGRGYLLVATDGEVRAFGDARKRGDARSPLHPPGYPASLQPPAVRAVGLAVLGAGPQPARRGPLRITFLGDSLAVLTARYTADYVAAHHLDATVADGAVLGCGVVGALTLSTYSDPTAPAPTLPACAQWRQQYAQAVAEGHPDVVAVVLGYWESQRHGFGGSTVSLTTSAGYRAYVATRLRAVDAMARAAGARVVFVEPPDFGDGTPDANVTAFDTLVDRVAGATGAGRFDLRPLLDPGGRDAPTLGPVTVRDTDRVHLSAPGVEQVIDPALVPRLIAAAEAGRAGAT